jgi:hypothetical protein
VIDRAAYKEARAALLAIRDQRKAISRPFHEAMEAALKPTEAAFDAALARVDEITGGLEPFGFCETCREPIFDGDEYGSLGDAGVTCAEHAPMMTDIIESWERAVREEPDAWEEQFDTREEFDAWIAARKAEVAAKGDWKAKSK